VTPDGALLLDIAGRTAAGVLVAVEADGPTHFRQPDGALTGPTLYRNRALAVRGYSLVSVPGHAWAKLQNDAQRQQQYLMRQFEAAGVVSGRTAAQQLQQQQQPQQPQQQQEQQPDGGLEEQASLGQVKLTDCVLYMSCIHCIVASWMKHVAYSVCVTSAAGSSTICMPVAAASCIHKPVTSSQTRASLFAPLVPPPCNGSCPAGAKTATAAAPHAAQGSG
jgi:hypothetical protein